MPKETLHPVDGILMLSQPFQEIFGFVRKGQRPNRINLLSVMFSLAAKVCVSIGAPDVQPRTAREILLDLNDSLFRGEVADLRRCLDVLAKQKYVLVRDPDGEQEQAHIFLQNHSRS